MSTKIVIGTLSPKSNYLRWLRIISRSRAKTQIDKMRQKHKYLDLIIQDVLDFTLVGNTPPLCYKYLAKECVRALERKKQI